MSMLMLICVIVISTIELTTANVRRLERIETNIKSIDLKLTAYSLDVSTLKNDVADTNKKLDLILAIMNGTTTAHETGSDIDTASANNTASNPVSTLNNVEVTVHRELNRVRRAFVTEKKKLSQQQKRNNFQFREFAEKLNDTLMILNDRHDTKWMLAANSINESVVSVLGTVLDKIDNKLVVWNQSIHENLNENTNQTLSKLDILDHSIGSWNDSIHESLIDVDQKVISFINRSVIQHDNITKKIQNEMTSSMTKIHDAVHSMDYKQSFVNVITAIQSKTEKTDRLLSTLSHRSNNQFQSLEHKTDRILYKLTSKRDTVRLVNSKSMNQGRLEVYIDGNWGTVCDDSFADTEATVVCKMLGYRTGINKDGAYFGEGTLSIFMDEVDCRGTESSIQECEYDKSHDCSHSEDIGVICSD